MTYDELVKFVNWLREHHGEVCIDCRGNDDEVMLEAYINRAHVDEFNRLLPQEPPR